MDSIVLLLILVGLISLPFLRNKVSLILVYTLSAAFAIYGAITIVATIITPPNHLSPLTYLIGTLFVLLGLGWSALARKLYRSKHRKLGKDFER